MASSIDINKIVGILTQNQSEDLSQKGLNKIRKIILDKATDLSNKATSTLTPILQKLNITDINNLPSTCPSPDVINSVVPILNNFVQDINSQVSNIDRLNQTVNSSTTALKTTKQIIDTLNITISIATLIIQAIPPPGLPGQVVGAVDALDSLRQKTLFDNNGNPRIPQISAPLVGILISINIFNAFLTDTVNTINKILELLKKCSAQNNTVVNVANFSPLVTTVINNQNKIESTPTSFPYQDFLIEIEEKNYTPTVKQYRAVGRNNQGITLISTPYSFTSTPQILVEQLKFIIDRDNLKAN